ncbi:PepSY-associated TM helix domain-containing protein [Vibrio hepatarius]|uniref:PepSY-associated TM helix domain-containing protein n=1 Tax=Vibrio hepatarius TaxID=171383 RepID=UPI001C09285F|nr:PepSY domain-containing protein [Vibrio hepatarius]MBU2899043.1 PepSY domain-containing protein [Vibrio hepatarius]
MLGSETTTSPKEASSSVADKTKIKSRYFMVWRWHFYAGLYVVPFILMLSLTGLVMLFDDEIEMITYHDELVVLPESTTLPASQQLDKIQGAYPLGAVTQYIPSKADNLANKFDVRLADGRSILVTINQYNGEILGEIDRSDSWYQLANNVHGTLLMGQWGDYLIEIAASLSILLIITGVYLWWPRDNASKAGFLKLRFSSMRLFMRDVHANFGALFSLILLLFLFSGLAWTSVWGGKLVQAWNTFPVYYTWGDKPESNLNHVDLNHGSEKELPWNLEQSALPESSEHIHGATIRPVADGSDVVAEKSIGIDAVIKQAKTLGFTQFKLFLPQSSKGVYTLAANSMGGDISDPRLDKTTHIDQYSGDVLVDVTWDDYTILSKLMAAGVSLHQGDVSIVNKALNTLFCIVFALVAILGCLMWWIRRPYGKTRIGIPSKFASDGLWKTGIVSLALVAVFFPLAAVAIILFGLIDWLVFKPKNELIKC